MNKKCIFTVASILLSGTLFADFLGFGASSASRKSPTARVPQRIAVNQNKTALIQASAEQTARYTSFMKEVNSLYQELKKKDAGKAAPELFYKSPKGKYRLVNADSQMIRFCIDDAALRSAFQGDCAYPADETDFVAWSQAILTDIKNLLESDATPVVEQIAQNTVQPTEVVAVVPEKNEVRESKSTDKIEVVYSGDSFRRIRDFLNKVSDRQSAVRVAGEKLRKMGGTDGYWNDNVHMVSLYVSPINKYEVVALEDMYLRDRRFFGEQIVNAFPKEASAFEEWSSEIYNALNSVELDINRAITDRQAQLDREAELRRQHIAKFCELLDYWANLQFEYETLLRRFGKDDVSVLLSDDEDYEVISDLGDYRVGEGFRGAKGTALAEKNFAAYGCRFDDKLAVAYGKRPSGGVVAREYRCPKTDAGIAAQMVRLEKLYKEAQAPYLAIIEVVDRDLARLGKSGDSQSDHSLALLAFIDRNLSDKLSQERNQVLNQAKTMPSDADAYLENEIIRHSLHEIADAVENIDLKVEQSVAAIKSLYSDASETFPPSIAGLSMGATLFEAAEKLCSEQYKLEEGVGNKDEQSRMRKYSFSGISTLATAKDITLVFDTTPSEQRFLLLKAEYALNDKIAYDAIVSEYKQEMGSDAIEEVETILVGYDVAELRDRNAWAAWQIEYYERRARDFAEQELANQHLCLRDKTAARYGAIKLVKTVTTIKAARGTVVVRSDVGGKFATSVELGK